MYKKTDNQNKSERKISLRDSAKGMEPSIRIGKSGLSDGIIKEIRHQLENDELIKVKFLRACLDEKDKKELANELSVRTNSTIVERVGFVVVLTKNK